VTSTAESDNQIPSQKGDGKMDEHKHGEMDTSVQEKTFDGFIKYTTWGAVVSIGILLFAALVNG
jgi:hypothetical protein